MLEEILLAKDEVGSLVKRRLDEFKSLGKFGETTFNFKPFLDMEYRADLFSELCFCLLTANSSTALGIKAQREIGIDGFKSMKTEKLTHTLSFLGHRFAKQRVERIVKARKGFQRTLELLRDNRDPVHLRDLLSEARSKHKIEGFGLKEASHFLRNIGHEDVAIVDRHVFRFLKEKGLIPDYKTITRRAYLQVEDVLRGLGKTLGLSLAELDLYIFYLKTKRVLK